MTKFFLLSGAQNKKVNLLYAEYPFNSNYFQIGSNKLHYLDEGSGPVIVLVHGNPTWSYYYRNIVKLLSSRFRVIVPDHIGCGLSDKPQEYGYTLKQHVENLQALLQHLKISQYSLVVHDWGGAIGMGVATCYPERVEKIVVLNSAAFRSKRIPFRIQVCKWPVIGPLIVRGLNGFAWPATFMAVTKPLPKNVASAYIAPYDSWENRVAVSAFVQDIPLNEKHVSYPELVRIEEGLETLKDNSIPMMILWGGKDFCFDRVFYDEWVRRFPDAEPHYFEDGGHYVLEDKWTEVSTLLNQFFS